MSDFGAALVTRTKFVVPPLRRSHLPRERLDALLDSAADRPLTLLLGGTGYGKSSLLAAYLNSRPGLGLWYELTERDADPQLFALHVAHVFERALPGVAARSLALLALPGGAAKQGLAALDALADSLLDRLETETTLVLDDLHHLQGSPEALALANHLVSLRVPRLRLLIASRIRPDLPGLPRWRLQGDALLIDQTELAFRPDEAAALFERMLGAPPSADSLARLMVETEGWPIALQLMSQRQELGLPESRGSLRDLFDYLAFEVFDRLPVSDRDFLLATAPMGRLIPEACRMLTLREPEEALAALKEHGGFLVPLGDAYRFHHLFREFLLERLDAEGRLAEAHRRVAAALRAHGETEEAVDHDLAAGDFETAAEGMAAIAPALVNQGRYARLETWLAKLPPDLLDRSPALAIHQGDACRLGSRFDLALDWYDRALAGYGANAEGRSRAKAAKALVYLDTIQPAKAEAFLEEALAETRDPRRHAELLVMRAENKLNQGDAAAAERLLQEARERLPEIAENQARICLRTGRLEEARLILRSALAPDAMAAGMPDAGATKAHREAALVLSFIEALSGDAAAARDLAEAGLTRARRQGAPWTEAVAAMRLGHAVLLAGELEAAESHYRHALALAQAVAIPRLRAEALMGLALLAGRRADLPHAGALASEGLSIAQEAGDVWLSALLSLALGAVYAAHADPRAERWLMQAQGSFERCGDPFGQALVALFSARLAMALGEGKVVLNRIRRLLELLRRHDYGFLLSRPTLMGFAAREPLQAFLGSALDRGVAPALLMPWLEALDMAPSAPAAASEDGLRIRTLGPFRVWRGQEEIGARAWGREKARQLFHLFLACRGQLLPKARIIDTLWPELDPSAADGTFRVALNALNKVLEPDRKGGAPRFIQREGASYGLIPAPDVWIDVAEFERLLEMAQAMEMLGEDASELYREALELSEGDFLADYPQYDAWCVRERERLADRYKEAALQLARLRFQAADDAGAAYWAQHLIERDPCAEEAYRIAMAAMYRQGDRPMALRTYDRCVIALDEELGVDPMPETQLLHGRITRLEPL